MTEPIQATAPIGIFDSGVGGLTVLRALRERLPAESFVYLGDTARLPYGTKSGSTVERYALGAARHLLGHHVKLLVVACNTASSYALEALRRSSPVPVMGVIEPGAAAALATGARRIGVLGTSGTISSGAYQRALAEQDGGVEIFAAAAPLLVPLAEEGWGDHPVTEQVAHHYLDPMLRAGVQTIILGCTHYPLLRPSLERVVGPGVQLVDSASSLAEAVVRDFPDRLSADGTVSGRLFLELTDTSPSFLGVAEAALGCRPTPPCLVNLEEEPDRHEAEPARG